VTNVVLTKEQRQKIDKLINQVSQKEGIDKWEARTLIHKCICGGKCNWYKTRGREAGFDRSSVTASQRRRVEETVNEIMKSLSISEAEAQIHEFICPGHPRASK
jgi:Spy/CpxP family protein refolding chaperone